MSKSAKIFVAVLLVLITTVALFFFWPKKSHEKNYPLGNSNSGSLEPEPKLTTLFVGGDIMLSRNVAGKMYKADDFTLPFQKIKDITTKADISFANLESPFNNQGNHFVEGSLVFNADPKSLQGLSAAGFDVLSTANNHAFDQGKIGIDYTLKHLRDNNIIPVGTTETEFDLSQNVIKKNDILFGFLSYSYTALNDGGKTLSPYVADFNNLAQVKQDILTLKGHYADVVIVNMHAGVEYTRTPTQAQIDFAHAAIDAGADLVVGEHSHWVQTVEQYKDKWIFYGLGNLVFDQMWSQETREGLTLLINFKENEITKIELKPVIIDDYCCPRFANPDEITAMLSKVNPRTNSPIIMQDGKVNSEWK